MGAWIWIVLSILGSSLGNVLMKYASKYGSGLDLYLSLPFWFGGLIFGLGLVCYMRALETIPLAVAYPVVVGSSIVAITALAIVLFGERISPSHILGVLLIFTGLILLSRNTTLA